MKKTVWLTHLTMALILLLSSITQAIALDASAPDQRAKLFYAKYLKLFGTPVFVFTDSPETKAFVADFVSSNLLHYLLTKVYVEDGPGADYFLDAQEICDQWVNHITVGKPSIHDNKANVIVALGRTESQSRYSVNLVLEEQRWKIDSVKMIYRHSSFCD